MLHILLTLDSTYTWSVPADATIVNGQGSNTIRVNFLKTAGDITVEEVTAEGCVNDTATLAVSIQRFGIVGDIFDFVVDPFRPLGRQVPLFNRGRGKNGVNEENIISIEDAISAIETTIFPNPFPESASIQFPSEQSNTIINIYDVYGSQVSTNKFSGTQYLIERANFLSGIYFIQIVKENGETSNHKIIIQ